MGLKKSNQLSKLGMILIWSGLVFLMVIYLPLGSRLVQHYVFDEPVAVETDLSGNQSVTLPVDMNFGLVIPKLKINTRVFPNIDSQDKQIYLPVLKEGVAHALGSSLPNQPGVVFLFGHSSDNVFEIGQDNTVFWLLNTLENGDEIFVYYQEKLYRYEVNKKMIVWPSEVNQIVRAESGNLIVLQTCWPIGTTLKRLLVFGIPVASG